MLRQVKYLPGLTEIETLFQQWRLNPLKWLRDFLCVTLYRIFRISERAKCQTSKKWFLCGNGEWDKNIQNTSLGKRFLQNPFVNQITGVFSKLPYISHSVTELNIIKYLISPCPTQYCSSPPQSWGKVRSTFFDQAIPVAFQLFRHLAFLDTSYLTFFQLIQPYFLISSSA